MLYEAVFSPSDISSYPQTASKLAGKKIPLHGSSVAPNGPFKGQECYYIPNTTLGLIPSRDLKGLRSVPFVQWEATFNQLGIAEQQDLSA